jgi:hypothetical protein
MLPAVLEGAEGIVLDLRGNGGGDAEAMADVASLFLDDGTNLGRSPIVPELRLNCKPFRNDCGAFPPLRR